jgi:hypothetical protein
MCATCAILTLAVWLLSAWFDASWYRYVQSGHLFEVLEVRGGCVVLLTPMGSAEGHQPLTIRQTREGYRRWRWGYAGSDPSCARYQQIPIWPGVVAFAAPACILWLTDRRSNWFRLAGACPKCGYDRRGLAADAKCPECGKLPERGG